MYRKIKWILVVGTLILSACGGSNPPQIDDSENEPETEAPGISTDIYNIDAYDTWDKESEGITGTWLLVEQYDIEYSSFNNDEINRRIIRSARETINITETDGVIQAHSQFYNAYVGREDVIFYGSGNIAFSRGSGCFYGELVAPNKYVGTMVEEGCSYYDAPAVQNILSSKVGMIKLSSVHSYPIGDEPTISLGTMTMQYESSEPDVLPIQAFLELHSSWRILDEGEIQEEDIVYKKMASTILPDTGIGQPYFEYGKTMGFERNIYYYTAPNWTGGIDDFVPGWILDVEKNYRAENLGPSYLSSRFEASPITESNVQGAVSYFYGLAETYAEEPIQEYVQADINFDLSL